VLPALIWTGERVWADRAERLGSGHGVDDERPARQAVTALATPAKPRLLPRGHRPALQCAGLDVTPEQPPGDCTDTAPRVRILSYQSCVAMMQRSRVAIPMAP
jgi:hypothetical protein